MKKIPVLLTLILLLCVQGCSQTPPETELPETPGITDGSETNPPADNGTLPSDTSADTEEAETSAAPTPARETPYTLKITRPDLMIYKKPGYDYDSVGKLVEIGTYTIVEEATDTEGITWGKLKSGIGWIDLDKAYKAAGMIPITLEEIRAADLQTLDCHLHIEESAPHTRYLLLKAYEPLRDIRFSYMDFVEDGFQPGEVLYTLSEMKPGKPLVIGVVFHGDFTTFSLRFTCDGGYEASYRIYESGRNGAVELQEYPMQ